jgi:acyl-CoA synthetase (AMP-forming)/AMP-acid ligase II/alkylation response protein AidB-like acyl-CoA dehydrogenase/acyl carrier protein
VFLNDGEREEIALTFAELQTAVLVAAQRLSEYARPGDRVLLFYPSGLDFIVAFLGCLCSGVVAVPVSVPNRKRGLEIVAAIAADSGATCILSVGALLSRYEEDFAADAGLSKLPRVDTASWSSAGAHEALAAARVSVPSMEAPALLQYTSGSTGTPRGVIVTHGNLADNHAQQQRSMRNDEHAVIVSWLPMFHDMGLGTVLQALWAGAQCVLMSPSAFLQKPVRWLQAISRYRATRSGGPDFAFDLCARSVAEDDRKSLDLSSWAYAYNGSEPVRAATFTRFHEVFAPCGFRWDAFHALYGLAEATLFVTGEALDKGPSLRRFSRQSLEKRVARLDPSDNGQPLVACGLTWLTGRVLVVDPETLIECPTGHIGEIWVGGPSVAAGYWGKDVETRETFQAHTASGQGPFLRTGDLGFLHDEGLFVTGRSKDLIIVRGRNHYPQDIEDTVSNCHPALEPQRCAAFSVDSEDGESLVVAQEVKRSALRSVDPEDVFRAIRKSVSDHHGLYAAAIVLLRPLALPRTTSGKIRRKACRDAFLSQSLPEVASSGIVGATLDPPARASVPPASASPTAARLADWLRQYARGPAGADLARRSLAPEAISEFARQGLLGMQVGAQHGGLALRHGEAVRVLEQLGGVDLGASLFIGLNNYLGVWPILRHGQLRLQQELLPQLATGRHVAGFALTEPGTEAGADTWSSHADPVNGSGWRLYGKKIVIGGTSESELLNVFVRHKDRPGVSGFVVPRSAKGVGPTASVTEDGVVRQTLSLDGVFVEPAQLLGQLGHGEQVAFDAIRHSHLAIGAACLGGMKRCSQLIFQHATQRQIGEAGLVAHPVTMTRLGRITAEVTALECLVRLLAELADQESSMGAEAFTVCKLVGPEMLWQAVDDLVQLLGRRGLVETHQIRKLVDDARVLRGLEGPMEAGAAVLGAGLLDADLEMLQSLQAEVFAGMGIEPQVEQAASVLREARLRTAGGPTASRHWLHARAGELVTWVILHGAVERRRRAASNADLERTMAWVRSNLESSLSVTRAGPPPEVRLGAGVVSDALAAYDRSVQGLDSALERESSRIQGAPRSSDLRSWAVAWLAERLRVEESRIDAHRSFADHGVDSLAAVEFAKALADRVGLSLDETLLWNFPTIEALLSYLESAQSKAAPPARSEAAAATAQAPEESTLDDEIARLERELRRRS